MVYVIRARGLYCLYIRNLHGLIIEDIIIEQKGFSRIILALWPIDGHIDSLVDTNLLAIS